MQAFIAPEKDDRSDRYISLLIQVNKGYVHQENGRNEPMMSSKRICVVQFSPLPVEALMERYYRHTVTRPFRIQLSATKPSNYLQSWDTRLKEVIC